MPSWGHCAEARDATTSKRAAATRAPARVIGGRWGGPGLDWFESKKNIASIIRFRDFV